MKSFEQLIAEHNIRSQEAETDYVGVRDAVGKALMQTLELRRLCSAFELKLFEQIVKFDKDVKAILNNNKK